MTLIWKFTSPKKVCIDGGIAEEGHFVVMIKDQNLVENQIETKVMENEQQRQNDELQL